MVSPEFGIRGILKTKEINPMPLGNPLKTIFLITIKKMIRISSDIYAIRSFHHYINNHEKIFKLPRKFIRFLGKYLTPDCIGYPSTLHIGLTTKCNLKCFFCGRFEFPEQHLDLDLGCLYKLENVIRFAKTVDLTGWGEPLIYPKFEELLNYIFSINPGEIIYFITNGTKLSERHAHLLSGHFKGITISLNAACEATYNRDMVNGKFEQTIASVRSFLSALKENDKKKVSLSFVSHTKNFKEIPDFVILAHELGIDRIHFVNHLSMRKEDVKYSLMNIKKEWNEIVDRAKKIGKNLGITVHARKFFQEVERSRDQCIIPFEEVFIKPNGDVLACDRCARHIYGNAFETSFEKIWFGTEFRRLREKRNLVSCRTCSLFVSNDSFCSHISNLLCASDDFKEIEKILTLPGGVSGT